MGRFYRQLHQLGDCFNYEANAGSVVNALIDSPVTGDETDDRPMLAWIFNIQKYAGLYHQSYQEFLTAHISSGKIESMIESVSALISYYVEKAPTKDCTYVEYETAVSTLKEFCRLRLASVSGQLDGSIPSTASEQAANPSAFSLKRSQPSLTGSLTLAVSSQRQP